MLTFLFYALTITILLLALAIVIVGSLGLLRVSLIWCFDFDYVERISAWLKK